MNSVLKLSFCFIFFAEVISAQVGIKTSGAANLVLNQTSPGYFQNVSTSTFVQAVNELLDQNARFINETKSKMPRGICFKEVPTASLVRTAGAIPAGNGSDPSLSKIQVCCEGYERNVHNFAHCDPICKDGCSNGMCVSPDTCVCLPGHIRNLAQFCIPTCPIGCANGICQEDNSCSCNPGYKLDFTKKFCVPHCSQSCGVNGNCTEPDTCTCSAGFELNSAGGCIPKCENCQFGHCKAPGECICNVGYRRTENECEPICSDGCHRGECTAPNVCTCRPGHDLDKTGTKCIPHCDRPCLNGFCDGQNLCACNPGYIPDKLSPNICNPHCAQGCPNGYCTAPNLCLCKPGFVKMGVKGNRQCTPI